MSTQTAVRFPRKHDHDPANKAQGISPQVPRAGMDTLHSPLATPLFMAQPCARWEAAALRRHETERQLRWGRSGAPSQYRAQQSFRCYATFTNLDKAFLSAFCHTVTLPARGHTISSISHQSIVERRCQPASQLGAVAYRPGRRPPGIR